MSKSERVENYKITVLKSNIFIEILRSSTQCNGCNIISHGLRSFFLKTVIFGRYCCWTDIVIVEFSWLVKYLKAIFFLYTNYGWIKSECRKLRVCTVRVIISYDLIKVERDFGIQIELEYVRLSFSCVYYQCYLICYSDLYVRLSSDI